jgi:hypothetical protein
MTRKLLTADVAARLGVTPSRVKQLVDQGKLAAELVARARASARIRPRRRRGARRRARERCARSRRAEAAVTESREKLRRELEAARAAGDTSRALEVFATMMAQTEFAHAKHRARRPA